MRGFNLTLFFLVVLALVIVAWLLATNGTVSLGGYPGPGQPPKINPPPVKLP